MTPAEIIYQRRIAVLDHAQKTGNVAEACRVFGISRTRHYEWKNVADRYGLEDMVPKARRPPQMPEGDPHPRRRGPLDPGRAPTDDRLSHKSANGQTVVSTNLRAQTWNSRGHDFIAGTRCSQLRRSPRRGRGGLRHAFWPRTASINVCKFKGSRPRDLGWKRHEPAIRDHRSHQLWAAVLHRRIPRNCWRHWGGSQAGQAASLSIKGRRRPRLRAPGPGAAPTRSLLESYRLLCPRNSYGIQRAPLRDPLLEHHLAGKLLFGAPRAGGDECRFNDRHANPPGGDSICDGFSWSSILMNLGIRKRSTCLSTPARGAAMQHFRASPSGAMLDRWAATRVLTK